MPRTTIPTHAAKNAKVWVDNVIRYNFAQSYRNRGKTVLIIRYKPLQKYYFEFMWSRCDFFKHCTLINNCCQKESKSYKHCILRILYISVSSLLYFWILTWMWYLFISLLISVACTSWKIYIKWVYQQNTIRQRQRHYQFENHKLAVSKEDFALNICG